MENKNITIFGDGLQKRDYIFIDDLAEAMVAAALNENIYGKNYNLGFGSSIKLVKAAQLIVDTYGQGDVIFVDWPKNWKNIESGSFEVNVDKIKNDLDWFPRFNINDGILQTIEYYKKYHQHYW
jgi:nucleoside-diphosphate-sugar epimerase